MTCRLRTITTYALPNISLRYPQLAAMQISFNCAKVVHRSGRTQTIPLKWIKTGFGGNYRPRYAFVCQCGRSVISVYCHYDGLACRYCWNAVYASQVCDRYRRPVLQARRSQAFLKLKAGLWQSTRNRLQARIAAAKADHRYLAHSKRIRHSIVQHRSPITVLGVLCIGIVCGSSRTDHMPAADFVALISIAAVLTAAWIAGSAMSWARAFLAVITIAAVLAAAWIMLR
jgi:hypothetical protein